jgi:hypothetical protein
MQALRETELTEEPLGNSPEDLSWASHDKELCKRLAQRAALPDELSVAVDKLAILQVAAAAADGSGSTSDSRKGISDYQAAYTKVRARFATHLRPGILACVLVGFEEGSMASGKVSAVRSTPTESCNNEAT